MSVTPAKAAKGRADRYFSLLIRATKGANGCQACGKNTDLQCAHVLSRSFAVTRCMTENAFALCGSCHWLFTNNALEWGAFIERTIGIDAYHELWELARSSRKVDWVETARELKARLAELEAAA